MAKRFFKLPIPSIVKLEQDRFKWSVKTFPKATAKSSLKKAEEEIKEIRKDLNNGVANPLEYADAIMCILDSAGRAGLDIKDVLIAFQHKLAINKKRTWKRNPDNTYSHERGKEETN